MARAFKTDKSKKEIKWSTEKVKEFQNEGPRSPAGVNVMGFLKNEAKRSLEVALVPFYGCSRCHFSRSGCVNWKCNPEKFQEHFKKYPEKYEGKVIRPSAWKDIGLKELMGSS